MLQYAGKSAQGAIKDPIVVVIQKTSRSAILF